MYKYVINVQCPHLTTAPMSGKLMAAQDAQYPPRLKCIIHNIMIMHACTSKDKHAASTGILAIMCNSDDSEYCHVVGHIRFMETFGERETSLYQK